jgi:uncharacterized protein (TIGR02646 family)
MLLTETILKTVAKSLPPNELTVFANLFPTANWESDFRNHSVYPNRPGHDYQQIKKRLINDQGGLCAYCEKRLPDSIHLQKVEHYHPKSDKSVPAVNWGLQWSNLLAVCTGGEHADLQQHPLPANLSCDSHKNHWLDKLPLPAQLARLATLQNPQTLMPLANPFDFERQTGRLTISVSACQQIDMQLGLVGGSTYATLDTTINTALNLNCHRLCMDRMEVLAHYNAEVKKARLRNDRQFLSKLAVKWFGTRWPSFFTTRRILLGSAAEAHLTAVAYQG